MEELSRQLRAEIDALQEYIGRMEDRYLVTTWTTELLNPLERLENRLAPDDLESIVVLLQRVRDQFSLNGSLAPQINRILARYPQYLNTPIPSPPTAVEEPAQDPAPDRTLAEDEERPERTARPRRAEAAPPPVKPQWDAPEPETSEDLSGMSIDVFTARGKASAPAPTPGSPPDRSPSPSTLNLFPLGERKGRKGGDTISATPRQDLFLAHKIRPADLKAKMRLSLPSHEQVQLDFKLQKKMASRLVNTLREHAAEESLILVPRVTQFLYEGTVYACTATVLTTLFRPLIGNLEEWSRYRGNPFMDETPEAGWALITPEAQANTVGRSYADQHRLLRERAEELGVAPRMVRRRTLVEALYDLIAVHLVLGLRLNEQTQDATASEPTGNNFVAIYFAPEGIRVADLPRTASHPALGVSPSL
ncbi:MAG: hypothetical protein IT369_00985 [Candidatus Latescibacteria bacterium]|nr:hypothetical protein [Candidatus Latescibacterota bacterium]